jgi:hypothetical protein
MLDRPVLNTTFKAAIAPKLSILPYPQPERFPYWREKLAPRIVVFDVTDPAAPAAISSTAIGTDETIPNGVIEAADGLVVVGAGNWKSEYNGIAYPMGTAAQSVHVIEVPDSGSPVVRPGIDLPGELFAVTELDSRGFLAYTRTPWSDESPAITVSACDGYDAYEISALEESADAVAAAAGRRLFVAKSGSIARYRLNRDGTWSTQPRVSVGWRASQLRIVRDVLVASDWRRVFAIDSGDSTGGKSWSFPTWGLDAQRISVAQDGDLLVPFGEYGAERLER